MTTKHEAVSVHLVGAEPGVLDRQPPDKRRILSRYETYVLTANDPVQCILPQDPDRIEYTLIALDNDIVLGPTKGVAGAAVNTVTSTATTAGAALPSPSQPAVPATGVAQQNVNAYPVQVVISANGATITNVSVNGITVGTAAGTYTIPAFGAISIAYSVAVPTWVWSNANPANPATTITTFAPNANGGYIPKQQSVILKETGQVYAGVTTTATNSRVTVIDTYYEAPDG